MQVKTRIIRPLLEGFVYRVTFNFSAPGEKEVLSSFVGRYVGSNESGRIARFVENKKNKTSCEISGIVDCRHVEEGDHD